VIAIYFILMRDQHGFDKNCAKTRNAEHMFLELVGSVGHVVHSGAFGHEMSTHFRARAGPVRLTSKSHWDTL
jgi:hypothetical protein